MKLAVIGTGIVGTKIAERLLHDRFDVHVFNRTQEKAMPLKSLGAKVGSTSEEVILETDLIILTLSDKKAIDDVLFRNQNTLKNKTILQMGTISPEESIALSRIVQQAGGEYLECPILGSRREIEEKTLIVMAGGPLALYEKLETVLSHFGSEHHYVGEVGQASALKLALNHLIASHVAGFCLSLGIIKKNGIDPAMFMSILQKSSLYAPMFGKKMANWAAGLYTNPNFSTKHLLKDVRLIVDHAESLGLNTVIVRSIESLLDEAVEQGLAELDYSSVFNTINRIES